MNTGDRPADKPATVDVQVTATLSGPASSSDVAVEKVIVAVHGVGDQHTFATIQAVVNQFCAFHNHPAGVPLGQFHTGSKTFSLPDPYPRDVFGRLAFAEVYWAKIPRTVVDDKYMLEESKKWARTIIERLRLRWRKKGSKGGCRDHDFTLVKQVLSEMIEAVAVLDRICFVAEKAGLFTFDLRKLLDDYLGDVQIVAEFGTKQTEILDSFRDLLAEAHKTYPSADIFIVAHSEGTVVSFLGLLNAFREKARPEWANHVRGMMTIGSPIDKHLVLWPELFGEGPPLHAPDRPLEWRNYYDRGDPIGFSLDDARAWIKVHGWESVFNFPPANDHGFTRYPFPGKAHVDYWTDEAVFGHFLSTVVKEEGDLTVGGTSERRSRPPADDAVSKVLSYVVPYLAVGALILVAVYILFKTVVQAIDPAGTLANSTSGILVNVLRNTFVVCGITVAARVPRLTKHVGMRAAALAFAALTCAVYWLTAPTAEPVHWFGVTFQPGVTTVVLAAIAIGLSYVFGAFLPSWGVTPLLIGGGIVVVGKVIAHLRVAEDKDVGALWPVFLATGAFLYLWWLAALILDLTVTWHWYIRHARLLDRIDEILGGVRGAEASTDASSGKSLAPQVQR